MDQETRLAIFQAQTKNVRVLEKAYTQTNRAINLALKRGDEANAQVQTKMFALVFCAWAEANFSKLIHTPYGFTLDEIRQIKQEHKLNGIQSGWEKCIELGLSRVRNKQKSNYVPNIRQRLKRLVMQCVVEPSDLMPKFCNE